jgi:hypothetical protein
MTATTFEFKKKMAAQRGKPCPWVCRRCGHCTCSCRCSSPDKSFPTEPQPSPEAGEYGSDD